MLKISHLVAIDQHNRKPCLICNSTAAPNEHVVSVELFTDTTNKPAAIQFKAWLVHILQLIWEAHSNDDPAFLSKWYILDV